MFINPSAVMILSQAPQTKTQAIVNDNGQVSYQDGTRCFRETHAGFH